MDFDANVCWAPAREARVSALTGDDRGRKKQEILGTVPMIATASSKGSTVLGRSRINPAGDR